MNFSLLINVSGRRDKWWKSWHLDLMGWEKKGKRFLHFDMCSFFVFSFPEKITRCDWQTCCLTWKWRNNARVTSIVENGLTNVESSSQRVIDKLKVSFEESMTKVWEINNFLIAMEEKTSGDDLKDSFDQVLLDKVTSDEDEKEIASMKNEFSPSNQS